MISILKRGLKSSWLIFFLDKSFSRDYIEMFMRARKHVQVEEVAIVRCQEDEGNILKKKRAWGEPQEAQ